MVTSAAGRPRVLVMCEDMGDAAHRCAQLTTAGFDAIDASDAIEALMVARSSQVDLALLHIPVDAMVAMDLPTVLRQVCDAAYLPVVILADRPSEQQLCRFLDFGADEIVASGASAGELGARLRALLRIKELHEQLIDSRAALELSLKRERELLDQLRADNANLRALATTDPLTRLQNTRAFREIFEHEFAASKRYNQPLGLLTLDVDHFKIVNDTHGHPCGDYVLKELAVILKNAVRQSDAVGRTGGEEFAIVLPRADRPQVEQFAQRIRQAVAQHDFVCYGRHIAVTISIGSAVFPSDAMITEPAMQLYLADQCLLMAKNRGRNRVVAVGDLDAATQARLRRQYLQVAADSPDAAPAGTAGETEVTCSR